MCLYNVVVLSAVGLTFTLLLEEKVVMIYGIMSSCVIIGTTLTQAIVFIPKVCCLKIRLNLQLDYIYPVVVMPNQQNV